MDYEIACNRLCDDVSHLLIEGLRPPTKLAAFAAGRATQDLAAAFHHAAGYPKDRRWSSAIESVERFLEICAKSDCQDLAALRELQRFVNENADLLRPRIELKLAS
ncbi:MAG: hypothetical protein JO078_12550 [Candidatus Eremiobacteraeota bacterium]|nr:hypothetical protein [Candidatus Eremiobacteraeota bacterium]MBV9057381.1 hypothetical protein [Candidatus Eremiobacteraeota bacterium]MBV9700931.1 hypothetical protein [Candidatus Eremiobacteraeota bacterium]